MTVTQLTYNHSKLFSKVPILSVLCFKPLKWVRKALILEDTAHGRQHFLTNIMFLSMKTKTIIFYMLYRGIKGHSKPE